MAGYCFRHLTATAPLAERGAVPRGIWGGSDWQRYRFLPVWAFTAILYGGAVAPPACSRQPQPAFVEPALLWGFFFIHILSLLCAYALKAGGGAQSSLVLRIQAEACLTAWRPIRGEQAM